MKKSIIVLIIGIILCITGIGLIVYSNLSNAIVTITYKDGTIEIKNSVKKGEITNPPYTPEKEDYEFLGWYSESIKFDFSKPIDRDIVLIAKWEEIKEEEKPEEFTVTFNTDGGSEIPSQNIKENGKVTKPENPTKKNYDFVNWYLDDKEYDFDTKVTKDITLVAKWKFNGVYVSKITLDKTSYTMNVGEKIKLNATITPSNSTNKYITWTSSNNNVATVSNGNITAVGGGTATITATIDGKKATCTITVIKPITYSYEIKDVEGSTTGQCYIYIKSSEGNYVNGKLTITYTTGGSETISIPSSGYMFPNRTSISSITNVTAN